MENSKTSNQKITPFTTLRMENGFLFALRAALLQISVSQTNGATRNNYATGLGCVRTSLFSRFRHAAVAVDRDAALPCLKSQLIPFEFPTLQLFALKYGKLKDYQSKKFRRLPHFVWKKPFNKKR